MDNKINQIWNEQNRKELLANLQKLAGVSISDDEIVTESEMMYKDELDDSLLPNGTTDKLPEQIIVNYYEYNDWVVYGITDIDQNWLLVVGILYKGKLVKRDKL